MAKVPKYDKETLEALDKPSVVATARQEREAGAKCIGSLARGRPEIIKDLLKIKIPRAPKEPPTAAEAAETRRVELEAELKALSLSHPRTEGPTETVRAKSTQKVVEPVKLDANPSYAQYKVWKRTVDEWLIANAEETQQYLCTHFTKCITPEQREVVFAVIPKGQLTTARILAVLDEEYAGDEITFGEDSLEAYRQCRRSGRTLAEFVRAWKQLRRKALVEGVLVHQPGDYQDLIKSAELKEAQKIAVLGGLRQEQRTHVAMGGDPEKFDKLEATFGLLKDIERALHTVSGERQPGRRGGRGGGGDDGGAALVAQTTNEPKTTCGTCGKQHKGACWHAQGGSGGKGRGKGKKNSRKQGKGQGKGAKGAKGGQSSSDWKCSCGWLVFGRSQAQYCGKCGKQKPAGEPGVPKT